MKFTKETLKRTIRTFVEAAVAYIVVNIAVIDFGDTDKALKSALIGLAVSAIAAGLAAVLNLEKSVETESEESKSDET